MDIVENSHLKEAGDREIRLEKKLTHSEAKVSKLDAQLEASRRTNKKLTDEKLDLQAHCRAAQERASHTEAQLSEMIGRCTILEDQLKTARKVKGRGQIEPV